MAALTVPACAPAAASGVNVPLATVPLSPSTVQVACPGSLTALPLASNALTVNAVACPGLIVSSVGVTSSVATAPAAFSEPPPPPEPPEPAEPPEPPEPFAPTA
jgi:hypothetical protein